MEDSPHKPARPRALTWIGRLGLGAFLLLALVVLWPVITGTRRPPDLAPWMYPGAQELARVEQQGLISARLETDDAFTNVVAYYQPLFGMQNVSEPAFRAYASARLGIGGRVDSAWLSSGLKTQDRVTTMLSKQGRRFFLLHVTQAMGDARCSIVLAGVNLSDKNPPADFPEAPMLDLQKFPGSQRGAGGQVGGLKLFQYSSEAPLADVGKYYAEGSLSVAKSSDAVPPEDWRVWWPVRVELPVATHDVLQERAMVWLGPWGAFLVHASQATPELPTEMVLGVAY